MSLLRLPALEWRKFSPNPTFRVFCALYVGFFILMVLLTFLVGGNIEFSANGQRVRPVEDLLSLPRSWELVAYIGSWMNVLLLGLMGVFMMTLELSHKTLRQNIIAGMTRGELFVARMMTLAALSALGTIVYLLIGAVTGLVMTEPFALDLLIPSPLGVCAYFIQGFGYALLGTLVGLWIRQSALATLAYISYVFILESVFRWLVYLTVWKSRLLLYLPDHLLEGLVPFPVPKVAQGVAGQQTLLQGLAPVDQWSGVLVCLVVFSAIYYRVMSKSDL